MREEYLHVCVSQRGARRELCRKGHTSWRKMFPEIEIFRNLAEWEIVRTYSVIRWIRGECLARAPPETASEAMVRSLAWQKGKEKNRINLSTSLFATDPRAAAVIKEMVTHIVFLMESCIRYDDVRAGPTWSRPHLRHKMWAARWPRTELHFE